MTLPTFYMHLQPTKLANAFEFQQVGVSNYVQIEFSCLRLVVIFMRITARKKSAENKVPSAEVTEICSFFGLPLFLIISHHLLKEIRS
jgi:hypothetical protein